jgi:hypothetical protein
VIVLPEDAVALALRVVDVFEHVIVPEAEQLTVGCERSAITSIESVAVQPPFTDTVI